LVTWFHAARSRSHIVNKSQVRHLARRLLPH
jgi:hypothetical protein